MKPDHPQPNHTNPAGGDMHTTGKSKMVFKDCEQDAGDDELLAVLGYKVKSSDMAGVADKLQHLEEAMAMGQAQQQDVSQLGSDSVHYNPSDLSSWLESINIEINPNQMVVESSSYKIIFDDSSSSAYDLKAIPGKAVFSDHSPNKKLKLVSPAANGEAQATQAPAAQALVVSEETGVQLVHTLMACAEAIQDNNLKIADALLKHINLLAVSQIGAMRKVAIYFAEALTRRIYRLPPQSPDDSVFNHMLEMHFYEACPYLKFAHFTANQAILQAFSDKKMVHVVDFSMKQGLQWPALMQALAVQPGGPPSFRLTAIGPPSNDHTDYLQEVGWKLAQFAETIGVKFEYRGFVANSLADLDASIFDLREGETVAVNSVFELHQLLGQFGRIDKLMSLVREMKAKIFTVVEQEANHNGLVFLERFNESLNFYSTLFDSLESCGGGGGDGAVSDQDKLMSEVYLGKQICNILACEGTDRVERHEPLTQWRNRFNSAGFEPIPIGSNAYKQASMLLDLYAGGNGYRVEEHDGCLMLGWHNRPLITASAWKLSG